MTMPVNGWEELGELDVLLVDEKLLPAADGLTSETLSPATDDVLGVAADGTAADLGAASPMGSGCAGSRSRRPLASLALELV